MAKPHLGPPLGLERGRGPGDDRAGCLHQEALTPQMSGANGQRILSKEFGQATVRAWFSGGLSSSSGLTADTGSDDILSD